MGGGQRLEQPHLLRPGLAIQARLRHRHLAAVVCSVLVLITLARIVEAILAVPFAILHVAHVVARTVIFPLREGWRGLKPCPPLASSKPKCGRTAAPLAQACSGTSSGHWKAQVAKRSESARGADPSAAVRPAAATLSTEDGMDSMGARAPAGTGEPRRKAELPVSEASFHNYRKSGNVVQLKRGSGRSVGCRVAERPWSKAAYFRTTMVLATSLNLPSWRRRGGRRHGQDRGRGRSLGERRMFE